MYGDSIDNGKLRKRDGKSNPLILRTTSTLSTSEGRGKKQGGYVGWGTGSNGNITFPVAFTQNLTFATGQGAEGTSIPRTSSVSNTGAVLFNVGTDGGHYSGFAKWIATGL